MTKQEIFNNALATFNTPAYPFYATIENDKLVLTWNWKDVNNLGVLPEKSTFKCIVEIIDDTKYKITDKSSESSPFGVKSFSGKQIGMSKQVILGKNNLTNESGIFTVEYKSKTIHEPLIKFLESCGLTKKKGLFG